MRNYHGSGRSIEFVLEQTIAFLESGGSGDAMIDIGQHTADLPAEDVAELLAYLKSSKVTVETKTAELTDEL
jgi:hypothetical protein